MIDVLLLIAGLLGLWAGTELIMRSAMNIARRYNLSEFFIGLVILSIGSDLPELAIAVSTGLKIQQGLDASGVVIGSSIGSAFGQIGLVMGILGLAGYITISKKYIFQHGAVLLASILLLALMAVDGVITRTEGATMLIVYFIYLVVLFKTNHSMTSSVEISANNPISYWLMLTSGMAIVILSSDITVNKVTLLATQWNIPQTLVSILVVGVGTSLPELSISVSALIKKRANMSVGNLIGSNILDTLVPIGLASVIANTTFESNLMVFDLPFLFCLSLIVLFFLAQKRGLQRNEAIVILVFYFSYVALKILTTGL